MKNPTIYPNPSDTKDSINVGTLDSNLIKSYF